MADIKALALSAKHKLSTGAAISEIDAISKAITGVGIRNKADVKRLKSEVGTQFARDKRNEQRLAGRRRAS